MDIGNVQSFIIIRCFLIFVLDVYHSYKIQKSNIVIIFYFSFHQQTRQYSSVGFIRLCDNHYHPSLMTI